MSTKFLGETVDIHGGGGDLAFPHHECEIAQIEPVTRRPFVRVWMHAAMVYHDGQKMSKSLGNLIMVRDLLRTYAPDAIRIYLTMHHYRQSWSYDEVRLQEAADLAGYLRMAATAPPGSKILPSEASEAIAAAVSRFETEMDDDLNTPGALLALADLASDIRDSAAAGYDVVAVQTTLRMLASIFGLRLDAEKPEMRVVEGWDRHLQRTVIRGQRSEIRSQLTSDPLTLRPPTSDL